jgi:predicted transcriptional regulator
MKKTFRDEILAALSKPATVTELKNKIPRIKSFGTLAYHLEKLEKENLITKKKENKKQGQPTTYSIVSEKIRKIFDKYNRKKKQMLIAFLKFIKNNPNIGDREMINKLEQQGFDKYLIGDTSMDSSNDNYSVLAHRITPKGEKFLKENDKMAKEVKNENE